MILAMPYYRTIVRCTTIGVTAFHFCVRYGNRWYYSTMVARKKRVDNKSLQVAERTGIEPATSCVTGRHSNRLNYRSASIVSLAMTYSRTIVRCTTIGVTAFHFCVRYGNRWIYSTMVAKQIL